MCAEHHHHPPAEHQKLIEIKGLSEAKVDKLVEAARGACPWFGIMSARDLEGQVRDGGDGAARGSLLKTWSPWLISFSWGPMPLTHLLVLQRKKQIVHISTGCQALDELLGGGIESKAVRYSGQFMSLRAMVVLQKPAPDHLHLVLPRSRKSLENGGQGRRSCAIPSASQRRSGRAWVSCER